MATIFDQLAAQQQQQRPRTIFDVLAEHENGQRDQTLGRFADQVRQSRDETANTLARGELAIRAQGLELVKRENPDGTVDYIPTQTQAPRQVPASEQAAVFDAYSQWYAGHGLGPKQSYEQMAAGVRAATVADNSVMENFGGAAAHALGRFGTGVVGAVSGQYAQSLNENIDAAYAYDDDSSAALAGRVAGNLLPLIPALVGGPAAAASQLTPAALASSSFGTLRADVAARRNAGQQISLEQEFGAAATYALAELLAERTGLSAIQGPVLRGKVVQSLAGYARAAGVNASEEVLTQVAQNAIDRHVLDSDRAYTEGAVQAGAAGGLVGVGGRGIAELAARRATVEADAPVDAVAPAAQAPAPEATSTGPAQQQQPAPVDPTQVKGDWFDQALAEGKELADKHHPPMAFDTAQDLAKWYGQRFDDEGNVPVLETMLSMAPQGGFVLRQVPLDQVDANTLGREADVDQAKVQQFAQRAEWSAPPAILIGDGSAETALHIADGTHRTLAARLRGDPTIPAYVPAVYADRFAIVPPTKGGPDGNSQTQARGQTNDQAASQAAGPQAPAVEGPGEVAGPSSPTAAPAAGTPSTGAGDVGPAYNSGDRTIGQSTLPSGLVSLVGRDPQLAQQAIAELQEYVANGPPLKPRRGMVYRVVEAHEAKRLAELSGLDVSGYQHVIDSFALRHVARQHGDQASEELRGQTAPTAQDLARIPEVVAPENFVGTGKSAEGLPTLIYQKRFNGSFLVVEEVRDKRRHLAVLTAYKKKAPTTHGEGPAGVETPQGPHVRAGSAPVQTIPPGPTTVKPPAPKAKTGKKGTHSPAKGFSRSALEDRLLKHLEETGGTFTAGEDAELAQAAGAGDPWRFHRQLPREVLQFIESQPAARRLFRVTEHAAGAGGSDAMAELGDRYWAIAERLSSGQLSAALDAARNSQDPQMQFLAALHENLPPVSQRKPAKTVDTSTLDVGHTFEIQGHKFQVLEHEDGYKVLKDGEDYPVVPLEAIDKLPIDKGTLRMDSTEVDPGDVDFGPPQEQAPPPRPKFFDSGTQDKKGIFGQTVFDAATGAQQSMFDTTKPASPVESAEDARIRRKFDPTATPQMFTGDQATVPEAPTPAAEPLPSIESISEMSMIELRQLAERLGIDPGDFTRIELTHELTKTLEAAQELQDHAAAEQRQQDDDEDDDGQTPDAPALPATAAAMSTKLRAALGKRGPKPDVTLSRQQINDFIVKQLGVAIGNGRFRRRALGFYRIKGPGRMIRSKVAHDVYTHAHEVGHYMHHLLFDNKVDPAHRRELEALGANTSLPSYTKKQVRMEGVAEFVRYWLMDPPQAAIQAPLYAKAFESQMLAFPHVWKAMHELRAMYQQFLAQDDVQRVESMINFDGHAAPSRSPNEMPAHKQIYADLFDDLAPIDWMRRDLEGPDKLDPADTTRPGDPEPSAFAHDAYVAARLNRGNAGMVYGWFKYGVRDRSGSLVSRSLEQIIAEGSGESSKGYREFSTYLLARRAIELYDQALAGKRELRADVVPEIGALGFTRGEAKAVIKAYETPARQKAAQDLYDWNGAVLDYLQTAGGYTPADIQAIKDMNANYVPMHRVMDDIDGGGKRGQGKDGLVDRTTWFQRLRGSGRRIEAPLSTLVRNTKRLVDNAEANRAAVLAFETLIKSKRGGVYADPVARPMTPTTAQLEDIRKTLIAAGVDPQDLASGPNGGPPKIDLQKTFTIWQTTQHNPAKREVALRRNGKIHIWQVHDPVLYEALTGGLRPTSVALVAKLLMLPKRIFRAGITLAPDFMVGNITRDQMTAGVQSKYGYGFLKGDFFRGLWAAATESDAYQLWLQAKGAGSTKIDLVNLEDRNLELAIRDIGRPQWETFLRNTVNPLRWIDVLEGLSQTLEGATRLGEFIRGLKTEGLSEEGLARAALASRDVTVDFSRGGRVSRRINQYAAFFNANLQGKDVLARRFRYHPARTTTRALLALTIPTLVLHHLLKDNPFYQERKKERQLYWLIPIGDPRTTDRFMRILKPWELGQVFGTDAELMYETIATEDPKLLKELIPDRDTAANALLDTLPTAIVPMMEVMPEMGYDYFLQRSIDPAHEQRLEPFLRYDQFTSETAKQLGAALDVSPRKIDHLIYGYTGHLGRAATYATDKLMVEPLRGSDKAPLPHKELTEWMPGVRRLFSGPLVASRAESVIQLNEQIRELERVTTTMKALSGAERDRYVKEHAEILQARERLKAAEEAMKDLRQGINHVYDAPLMPPHEKREQLDQLNRRLINLGRQYDKQLPLPKDEGRELRKAG